VSATNLSSAQPSNTTITTVDAPDLSFSSSTDPHPVEATTTEITYTITLANNGGADATGVTITSTIPNSTSYVADSASDDGTFVGGTYVVWNELAVAKDSSAGVSFQVTVTEIITDGDRLTNELSASSAEGITAASTNNSVTVGLQLTYLPLILKNN
jgi:uncharacterized repeat protein (TIGR01451 family)